MSQDISMCTIVPYFNVHDGRLDDFKRVAAELVEQTRSEPDCLFYQFAYSGNRAFCREGYTGAAGVLAHLANVDTLLKQALEMADLEILQIHGPADQLDQLKEPLAALNPEWFTVEVGFRN